MSQLFGHLSREFLRDVGTKSRDVFELILPPVDMFEDGTDLVIMLDMPGFEKDKIKTRLGESNFTVTAKREPVERDGVSDLGAEAAQDQQEDPPPCEGTDWRWGGGSHRKIRGGDTHREAAHQGDGRDQGRVAEGTDRLARIRYLSAATETASSTAERKSPTLPTVVSKR